MDEKMSMVNPKVEDLLEHTENKFTLVIEASQRARQITETQHRVEEGAIGLRALGFEDLSKKPLSLALQEIAEGKIEYADPDEDEEPETEGTGEKDESE